MTSASRQVHFRRSTFCSGGMCVEVAADPRGEILVRDSKNEEPNSPTLRFTKDEWTAFVAGVGAGEFSHDALLASP